MKELWEKKTVKVALVVIVILVAAGIVSISAQGLQRKSDYNGHVDAAEKYLSELNYEQVIVEYTLALEIEPKSKEILDALEETYLAYAQTYADIEEYESAIEILERGYAQTGGESLQAKIEELADLQAKKEEEERLLAEEAAEKEKLLAKEAAEKQKQLEERTEKQEQEKAEEEVLTKDVNEKTPALEQEGEKTAQVAEESDTLTVYQAKAAEYAFSVQREYHGSQDWTLGGRGPLVDARSLKTQLEFCEYFHGDPYAAFQGERGATIGAVNTSLLEETDTQCKILVSDIVFYTYVDSPFGNVIYFEFVIDKTTGQGTITDCYFDVVYVTPDGYSSMLELSESYAVDYYNCKGKVFDFNQ